MPLPLLAIDGPGVPVEAKHFVVVRCAALRLTSNLNSLLSPNVTITDGPHQHPGESVEPLPACAKLGQWIAQHDVLAPIARGSLMQGHLRAVPLGCSHALKPSLASPPPSPLPSRPPIYLACLA
jgi:hypothetical protein